MTEVGSFYTVGRTVYVVVNTKGTVEKLPSTSWWRVIALSFLQFFGKATSVLEVKKFLYPNRMF